MSTIETRIREALNPDHEPMASICCHGQCLQGRSCPYREACNLEDLPVPKRDMAREAGGTEMEPYDYGARPDRFIMRHEVLDHFAALVAAAEREACARVCEQMPELEHGWRVTLPSDCAAAIRARSNT